MLHLEGRVLGGCKLIRKIGEGGMGEVYLGEQIRVGNRPVAVKVVRVDDDEPGHAARDEVERRFQREATLLGQFAHPNILPVHDSGIEGDVLYLVMQFAPDGSLADAIKGRAKHTLPLPAPLPFTVDLIGQVAAALQYTHDRNVVHRDVKPGNVLLQVEPNGHWHALLADYGIARGQDSSSHKTQVTGTLAYMAPEQFKGAYSPASDQYALAVMTYQLLTGRTPYEGDLAAVTHGHMFGTPPALRTYNANLPPALDGVIARALAKDPQQRYPSVSAYADALKAAAEGRAPVASVPLLTEPTPPSHSAETPVQWPAPQQPKRERRSPGLGRAWIALLAAVVLLVAAVGGGGYLAQRQQRLNADATQTAQHGTQTASANGPFATQTSVSATQTAAGSIPTATVTPSAFSQDVTAPLPPPAGVGGTPILSDPQPLCDAGATGTAWVVDTNTSPPGCSDAGVSIAVQAAGSLACIEQQTTVTADGYTSVLATSESDSVVLGFRQGKGQTTGNQVSVTGYYFKVLPQSRAFVLYSVDAGGKAKTIEQGALPGKPGAHMSVAVLYSGADISLYVNGTLLTKTSDAQFSSGWLALCTDQRTTFSASQVFPLAS